MSALHQAAEAIRALSDQELVEMAKLAERVGANEPADVRRDVACGGPPRKHLTTRQAMLLSFIERSIVEKGWPPTLREIGAHMGIVSTNGVKDHLRALERKGYIARRDGMARGIKVVDPAPDHAVSQ